jgi:excinuclease ABC subunit C
VAAIVAFSQGAADRKRYRSFHVRNVRDGDEYGAMQEVLQRRFRRAHTGSAGWELPNLLVVDGGQGQLAIAERALTALGVSGLSVAALAKEKQSALGEPLVDRVYLPGRKNPIELREGGPALQILAHARDEAHRVSNALRVKLGGKRRLQSGLDGIEGVGSKTRALLLRALGTVDGVAGASAEALVDAGATRRQAEAIYARFHESQPEIEARAEESEDLAIDHAFE